MDNNNNKNPNAGPATKACTAIGATLGTIVGGPIGTVVGSSVGLVLGTILDD